MVDFDKLEKIIEEQNDYQKIFIIKCFYHDLETSHILIEEEGDYFFINVKGFKKVNFKDRIKYLFKKELDIDLPVLFKNEKIAKFIKESFFPDSIIINKFKENSNLCYFTYLIKNNVFYKIKFLIFGYVKYNLNFYKLIK